MELTEFMNNDLTIEDSYEFLNKATVQLGQKCVIIDVKESQNKNRPYIVAKFGGKAYKFDLAIHEIKKLLKAFGPKPKDWINKRLYVKSYPYDNGKRKGLTLEVSPLEVSE